MDIQQERNHLKQILSRLSVATGNNRTDIAGQSVQIARQIEYLARHRSEMDHAEKSSVREEIDRMSRLGEMSDAKQRRLLKLADSPYFGRVDFSLNGQAPEPFYIGVHSFADPETATTLIHDWRAPVASVFYDFEPGPAHYDAPGEKVSGELRRKRQYRIVNGELEYAFESGLHIHDELLQRELSRSGSDRMKHIAATIQREQNRVIRELETENLVIQGAAGSGKSSIALHRVAFLLYHFRDRLSSSDIMIIAPNKVFAGYISGILPELGEESIPQMTMEELATELLGPKFKFETFLEQVERMLEHSDPEYLERIRFKASPELLKKLDRFVYSLNRENFAPNDIVRERFTIPADFIRKRLKSNPHLSEPQRISKVVSAIAENLKIYRNLTLTAQERSTIRTEIKKMFSGGSLQQQYRNFFTGLGRPELLPPGSRYEWADVFPLIYLKMQQEKKEPFADVRHLVVDEMQDYTPVQYAVLNRLFNCRKTILGDGYQAVNPHSSTLAEEIAGIFPRSRTVFLNRSYRSTVEIQEFARRIRENSRLQAVDRHGEPPVILSFQKRTGEYARIADLVQQYSGNGSLAVLCKTRRQAVQLYRSLTAAGAVLELLDSSSSGLGQGAVITCTGLAKGLEFDTVIIARVTAENYSTEEDRRHLYVACTRAMHRLILTAAGPLPSFLQ